MQQIRSDRHVRRPCYLQHFNSQRAPQSPSAEASGILSSEPYLARYAVSELTFWHLNVQSTREYRSSRHPSLPERVIGLYLLHVSPCGEAAGEAAVILQQPARFGVRVCKAFANIDRIAAPPPPHPP